MNVYIDWHTCTHTRTHTHAYTHTLEYFLAVKKKHFTTSMSFERIILRGKKCTRLHTAAASPPWNSTSGWGKQTHHHRRGVFSDWQEDGGFYWSPRSIALPWSDGTLLSHNAAGVNTTVEWSDIIAYKLQVNKTVLHRVSKPNVFAHASLFQAKVFSVEKIAHLA